jgi:subtilase family serine protease
MFGKQQDQLKSLRERFRRLLGLEQLEDRTLLSIFTPAQIRHAYGFDQITFSANGTSMAGDGRGQTIAIVDAYDDPNIQSDLAHFDQVFNLPAPVLVRASPQGTLPSPDAGWAQEISLDVEWAHAIAPAAKILLVEAASASFNDLLAAVDYARNQPGVSTVSMSWGGSEFAQETSFDSHFTTPAKHNGVTFVASSGDGGAWYGPEWPASSPNVLSVGGTSLYLLNSSGAYGTEQAWSGSGGGFSSFENEPRYQLGVQQSLTRTTPDVAYDADPNTGFYVYDTYQAGGWYAIGGTSAGAPQWAALIAIADQGRALAGRGALDGPSQTIYALYSMAHSNYSANFHDVVGGSNGYYAGSGYDLATGLGTPRSNAVVQMLVRATGSGSTLTFASASGKVAAAASVLKQAAVPNLVVTATVSLPLAPATAATLTIAQVNPTSSITVAVTTNPAAGPNSAAQLNNASSLNNGSSATLQSGGGDNRALEARPEDLVLPRERMPSRYSPDVSPDGPIAPDILPEDLLADGGIWRRYCDDLFVDTKDDKAGESSAVILDGHDEGNSSSAEPPAVLAGLALALSGWGSRAGNAEREQDKRPRSGKE